MKKDISTHVLIASGNLLWHGILAAIVRRLDKKETSNLSQCLMAGKDQKITLLNDKQGREDNND